MGITGALAVPELETCETPKANASALMRGLGDAERNGFVCDWKVKKGKL